MSQQVKHNYCKFCAEDLSKLPLTANLTPHRIGLCTPTHNEVEAAIHELEIEDEREKEAIRAYWERERERKPGMYISGSKLLKAFIVIVGIVALPWLVVYAVAAWFGL